MTNYTKLAEDLRHADDMTADHRMLNLCARAAAGDNE